MSHIHLILCCYYSGQLTQYSRPWWESKKTWVDCMGVCLFFCYILFCFVFSIHRQEAYICLVAHFDYNKAISHYSTDATVCIFLPNMIPLLGVKPRAYQRPSSSDHMSSRCHSPVGSTSGWLVPAVPRASGRQSDTPIITACVCWFSFVFASGYLMG